MQNAKETDMRLTSRLSVVDPSAESLRALRSQLDAEDPGPDTVVVYASDPDPDTGFVFRRSELQWSREREIPAPPECNHFVYANATPLAPVVGFGTSLTDATVMQLDTFNAAQADALLEFYFGLCRMRLVRVPMGSCDFSVRQYSFVDHNGDLLVQPEDEQREAWLARIRDLCPTLQLLLAPWSAPPWMKTSNQYVGGALKPEFFETWARCLVDYCRRYERLGFEVLALSLQNEPRQLPYLLRQTWETMFFEPPQLARLSQLAADLPGCPRLLLCDDQKNLLQWLAEPTLAAVPRNRIFGAGVHSYQGTGSSLKAGTARALGKPVIVTEFCTGFHRLVSYPAGRDRRGTRHAAQYARDLIMSLRNGEITGYVDWNMVLDEAGGPNWARNFVDSLAWRDDEQQLRIGYMGWLFAHVAAFGAGTGAGAGKDTYTYVCESESVGSAPLVVCFADREHLYVTCFNDAWFGTQSYVLGVRGRFLHDTLGYHCCKTYVIKK